MRALAAATTGWGGVVVFFESEALPVYGLVDLGELLARASDPNPLHT
jgi:hypothetical protein